MSEPIRTATLVPHLAVQFLSPAVAFLVPFFLPSLMDLKWFQHFLAYIVRVVLRRLGQVPHFLWALMLTSVERG